MIKHATLTAIALATGVSAAQAETLNVGMSGGYFPFTFVKLDELQGFEVDFINAVAKETGDDNMFCMMLTLTPLAEDDCLVWLLVAINFGDQVTEEQIIARQDEVFSQDKWIVESQRPKGIPLDLQDELHVRVDKFSVAYRRWLKDLGLVWGVAA